MSLGKVPIKAGGGAQGNGSIEQGTQVSMATHRVSTTTRHRNSAEIVTNLYTYHGQPRGMEGEGQIAEQMHNYELENAPLRERVRVI